MRTIALLAVAELLLATEGNRLRVFDLASGEDTVLIERASMDAEAGRDINGMMCPVPDGSGRLVAGEDTGQTQIHAGWGVLTASGGQVGKLVPTSYAETPEPFGCAFDAAGRLFTSDVGDPGFLDSNGQLLEWFPPWERFPGEPEPYPNEAYGDGYCKLATDLGTAGALAFDTGGRLYVAAASDFEILRFSPPFPTSADASGGCGDRDALGSPLADRVQRDVLTGAHWGAGLVTYTGLAFAPNGNLYAASVATGRIGELDLDGNLVRMILDPDDGWLFGWLPPFATGTPQGLAVDSEGSLYYADLDLVWDGWKLGPGSDGKIWRIRFDEAGDPAAPEIFQRGLAFPDGLTVIPGRLEEGAIVTAPVSDVRR